MRLLQLVRVGHCDLRALEQIGPELSRQFGVPWDILPEVIDAEFALHAERQQYHSTEILGCLQRLVTAQTWRVLGVTENDLYIPILTFVFGEAQMGGNVAVVSTHRLHQQFYGLAGDDDMFRDRLLKESLHELGHTLDLRHCEGYRCAMAGSHAVEWIDLKEAEICPDCWSRAQFPATEQKRRLWPF